MPSCDDQAAVFSERVWSRRTKSHYASCWNRRTWTLLRVMRSCFDKTRIQVGACLIWNLKHVMHLSIACPMVPPPPGRWWGFDQGGSQMYPKSPPGDRRNGQTAPPCARGDHSADWRLSMCPTPVTHLVVKFPTPEQSEAVPCGLGGGGGGLAIDRCIRASHLASDLGAGRRMRSRCWSVEKSQKRSLPAKKATCTGKKSNLRSVATGSFIIVWK